MRLLIAGSRTITDYQVVISATTCLYSICPTLTIDEIVSGYARGIDTLAIEYALKNNIPIKYFPANWLEFGKSAGYKRNEVMANYANILLAIWDYKSVGTKHMIDIAIKKQLEVYVYNYETGEMECRTIKKTPTICQIDSL